MSIVDIRRLFENEENRKYPPSEKLWSKILMIVDRKKSDMKKLERELEKMKVIERPDLPEPILVNVKIKGKEYFLDSHRNLYEMSESAGIASLVGLINENGDVRVHGRSVHRLKEVDVYLDDESKCYLDDDGGKYGGVHPYLGYVERL